jgi:phosphofructokinase-like protein
MSGSKHKVGILTGGGDCPGLNGVIRAVVRKVANADGECIGLLDGWRGLVDAATQALDVAHTDGIIARGGTILGSSRTNPFKRPDDVTRCLNNFQSLGLTGLVAIGGDDTLGVASRLFNEHKLPVVGVPKTIDNDLSATDFTFGFDTAINIVMEAVDRLRTTAESHRRIMVIETMGRHAGWIACLSGIAVAADYILIPEVPVNLEHMCGVLARNRAAGKMYGLVVVSEGAQVPEQGLVTSTSSLDEFGHVRLGGIAEMITQHIESTLKIEARFVVLGHLQRGGAPSAYDRVLATRFGIKAAELLLEGKNGQMAALKGNDIVSVPLSEAVASNRRLDLRYYQEASEFFK